MPADASTPSSERHDAGAQLLVIPRASIDAVGSETGVHAGWRAYVDAIFGGDGCVLMDADRAERDEQFKQLVVYVLLEHGGRFVHYTRRARDDDERLRGRSSIGLGGHVDSGDVAVAPRGLQASRAVELLLRVGEREVHEEVSIDSGYDPTFLGVVNDERDAVGRVHLGFVALWRLWEPHVEARQEGICDVELLTPEELAGSGRHLEGWSQLCLEHMRTNDP